MSREVGGPRVTDRWTPSSEVSVPGDVSQIMIDGSGLYGGEEPLLALPPLRYDYPSSLARTQSEGISAQLVDFVIDAAGLTIRPLDAPG